MEFGMGGMGSSASAYASTAPMSESPAFLYGLPSADTLRIDDLLDFSSPDNNFFGSSSSASSVAEPHKHVLPETKLFANQADFSSNHDSYSPASSSFADDLFIPSEEAAELEWLSRFVDDSFSDMPSVYQVAPPVSEQQHFHTDTSTAPGRGARSKRSRGSNGGLAAANWSVMPPPPSQSSPSTTSSSSSSDFPTIKLKADNGGNSRNSDQCDNNNNNNNGSKGKKGGEGEVRRCTHCASEKTPQWRTGPLGPKTLCNACGVRYKSGRLVPEYRPAASPTFVLTQHSNSHRKVLELRRQKELLLLRRDNAAGAGAAANAGARPELLYHDYEVC